MKKKLTILFTVCTGLIALLWFYAAMSKLIAFEHFQQAMYKQPFPAVMQVLLVYTLPPAEIIIGILLLTRKTIITGLYLSLILFSAFTVYIGLILLHRFGKVPCNCGGLIEHMGWAFHLWFNLVFILLTLISFRLNKLTAGGSS